MKISKNIQKSITIAEWKHSYRYDALKSSTVIASFHFSNNASVFSRFRAFVSNLVAESMRKSHPQACLERRKRWRILRLTSPTSNTSTKWVIFVLVGSEIVIVLIKRQEALEKLSEIDVNFDQLVTTKVTIDYNVCRCPFDLVSCYGTTIEAGKSTRKPGVNYAPMRS